MSDGDSPRFDIAVSFAGEDRDLVDEIVGLVRDELKIFYDEDFKVESWGKDLNEYFVDIYTRQSRYAVLFVSRHYAEKMWTRLERRSILSRALNSHSEYALPVRIDDTDLPGLLHTVGYLDARREGARGIADAMLSKAGTERAAAPTTWITGAPTTEAQNQTLLAVRPAGWEYLYYVGLVLQGIAAQEERFLDMEMGFALHRRTINDVSAAHEFLSALIPRFVNLAESFGRVLGPDVQRRAFGAPGEPGDPDRISHLARRFLDVYGGFLDIIEDVRGTAVPDEISDARDYAARAGERPVHDMREFFERFAATLADLPARLESGESITMQLDFDLDLDDEVMTSWSAAMNRAARGR